MVVVVVGMVVVDVVELVVDVDVVLSGVAAPAVAYDPPAIPIMTSASSDEMRKTAGTGQL